MTVEKEIEQPGKGNPDSINNEPVVEKDIQIEEDKPRVDKGAVGKDESEGESEKEVDVEENEESEDDEHEKKLQHSLSDESTDELEGEAEKKDYVHDPHTHSQAYFDRSRHTYTREAMTYTDPGPFVPHDDTPDWFVHYAAHQDRQRQYDNQQIEMYFNRLNAKIDEWMRHARSHKQFVESNMTNIRDLLQPMFTKVLGYPPGDFDPAHSPFRPPDDRFNPDYFCAFPPRPPQ